MPEGLRTLKSTQKHLLMVDDDAGQRSLLTSFLAGQNFHMTTAASGEEALQVLRRGSFDMIISDVRMPGISGLEMLRQVRAEFPLLPVLLVTAYADIKDAVGAMRDGAVNYLAKPIDLDELLDSVRTALGLMPAQVINPSDERPLPSHIIARSPEMGQVLRDAALVAPSDSRILITGESGVGKEIVADVIHAWSSRAQAPLLKINCAAIPESLLESELFGHEKGAFTGATQRRIGLFEEASGGSILLDEIAELPPLMQAKLLRVTQDGSFLRVGSNTVRQADARLIVATNRDLESEVSTGRFREDLFFRLSVMEISVPPLRRRLPDILPLAHHFATEFTQGRPRLSAPAVRCLESYEWPGNIRELRNAMERACLMARGDIILPNHLPARVQKAAPETARTRPSTNQRIEDVERMTILQTLRENRFNRSETARVLGISRRTLIYKLQHYKDLGFDVSN